MKSFDRRAPGYDRSILQKLMFEPVHRAALSAFDAVAAPPGDVLDVGCGTGRLLEAAALRWREAKLTGIDASSAMVAEARRKHEKDARFTFQQGDASALPAPSASFDAAFSTYSFHHWTEQTSGIREVARILRPTGLFVLVDLDPPLSRLLRPLLNWGDRARIQAPKEIRRLLEGAGFEIVVHRRFWPFSRAQLFLARKTEA